MKVIWNELAEAQLDSSIAFVSDIWGKATGLRPLRESRHICRLLAQNPHLGPPEPLLADRSHGYRSIVVGHYNKFIYFITESTIRIAAVWDTRLDPSSLVHEVS